ncbi:dienelactone hydrolase family protein [Actinomadura yumaensis]|uniref:dienelactone hydrolase family protein n=1 Tax=Actinomadura yumaensis TaxID=111807 RepID=UPI00360D66CB
MNRRLRDSLRVLPAAIALAAAGTAVAAPAQAAGAPSARAALSAPRAANPYERGPAPTESSVTAEKGPFAVEKIDVPQGSGTGFNKGTIYAPTDTSQGTFGAIAVSPGFVSPQAWIDWYGPRLASQGFVVMTLETLSLLNAPDERADQLLAALDYMTTKSKAASRIDTSRLAVMGHSMGGGGTLRAAQKRPTLRAAVPSRRGTSNATGARCGCRPWSWARTTTSSPRSACTPSRSTRASPPRRRRRTWS